MGNYNNNDKMLEAWFLGCLFNQGIPECAKIQRFYTTFDIHKAVVRCL